MFKLLPLLILATGTVLADGAAVGGARWINPYAHTDIIHDWSPELAADGAGNGVVIWNGGCEPLVAVTRDGGMRWSEPRLLKTNYATDDGDVDTDYSLATDGQGTWVAVWESNDTLGGTLESAQNILWARSADDGETWTDPAALNDPDSTFSTNARVATDGNGTWVAVWAAYATPGMIARSTDNGVTWEAPTPFPQSAFGGFLSDARVAADGSGVWIISTHTGLNVDGIGWDLDIIAVRSEDGGASWQEPAPLNPNAAETTSHDGFAQLAAGDNGTWMAVWQSSADLGAGLGGDADIVASRSVDGGRTWSYPVPVDSAAAIDAVNDGDAAVIQDPHGNWIVTWRKDLGSEAEAYAAQSTDDGVTWGDAELLFVEPYWAEFEPKLGAGNGASMVAWKTKTLAGLTPTETDILSATIRLPWTSTCDGDTDRDGFGEPGDAACPLGDAEDCDDEQLAVAPGAMQVCDGRNNDCGHPSWPGLAATNEADDDGDGLSECDGDCDDGDPAIWSIPGKVTTLFVGRDESGRAVLQWSAPDMEGGAPVSLGFDTLRSTAPFRCGGLAEQTCLESDDGDTLALDDTIPPSGQAFFYHVRARNGCMGPGTVGVAQVPTWRLRVLRPCDP